MRPWTVRFLCVVSNADDVATFVLPSNTWGFGDQIGKVGMVYSQSHPAVDMLLLRMMAYQDQGVITPCQDAIKFSFDKNPNVWPSVLNIMVDSTAIFMAQSSIWECYTWSFDYTYTYRNIYFIFRKFFNSIYKLLVMAMSWMICRL